MFRTEKRLKKREVGQANGFIPGRAGYKTPVRAPSRAVRALPVEEPAADDIPAMPDAEEEETAAVGTKRAARKLDEAVEQLEAAFKRARTVLSPEVAAGVLRQAAMDIEGRVSRLSGAAADAIRRREVGKLAPPSDARADNSLLRLKPRGDRRRGAFPGMVRKAVAVAHGIIKRVPKPKVRVTRVTTAKQRQLRERAEARLREQQGWPDQQRRIAAEHRERFAGGGAAGGAGDGAAGAAS